MIATALTLLKTLLKAVTPTTPNSPISSSEALRFLVTTCFALMFIAQPTTVYAQEAPNVTITTTAQTVNDAAFTLTGTVEAGATVDVLKAGTSIGAATVSGGTWSLAVTLTGGANVFTATASDGAMNKSAPTAAVTITLDMDAPNVSITSSTGNNGDTVNAATLRYTATFSEDVTGFEVGGITVTGTAGVTSATNFVTVSTTVYTFDVFRGAPDGTVIVSIAKDSAMDSAGNGNTASDGFVFTIRTPLTITSMAQTVNVNSFTLTGTARPGSDLTVSHRVGTSSAPEITLTTTTTNWEVEVTLLEGDNEFQVARNLNKDDTTYSNSVDITLDSTAPAAPVITSPTTPTNDDTITITGTTTVEGSTVTLTQNGNALTPVNALTPIDTIGPGATWSVDVTLIQGANTFTATATDQAGNISGLSDLVRATLDQTKPTIEITSAATSPTNTNPIPINLLFSEPLTGFEESDISVSGGVITAGSYEIIDVVSDGGSASPDADFTITPSADGLITVRIAADAAQDSVTNGNIAATFDITYDGTAPSVTITSTSGNTDSTVGVTTLSYTATFSEDVTGFELPEITVTGTANGGSPAASNLQGTGASYTFDVVKGSSDGSVIVSIAAGVAMDAAGNLNTVFGGFELTIDSTAPAVTITTTAQTVNDAAFTLAGTVEAGATVTLTQNDNVLTSTATATAGGTWTIEVTLSTGNNGANTFTATAMDQAGNVSGASNEVTVTLDTTSNAPVITPPTTPTNDNTITIAGTADAGATVTLTQNDNVLTSTATATAGGTWTIEVTLSTGNNGANTFTATAMDQAGNVSGASNEVTVTLDTTSNAPVITPPTTPTNDNTITIAGTADAGATVTLTQNDNVLTSTATATAGGTWTIEVTLSTGNNGANTFTATAMDQAGNVSGASNEVTVTLDTTSNAPVITPPTTPTNNNTLTITGTADAGATVTLTQNDNVLTSTATATAGGTWTIEVTLSTGNNGANTFTATAMDQAGNVSGASNEVTVTLDTTSNAPVITPPLLPVDRVTSIVQVPPAVAVAVDVKTLSFWVSVTVAPASAVPVMVRVLLFVGVVGGVMTGALDVVSSVTVTSLDAPETLPA